jgi:hypothetical protein
VPGNIGGAHEKLFAGPSIATHASTPVEIAANNGHNRASIVAIPK